MPRIAMVVSNPCTSDARVIKMANAASVENEVDVFGTLGVDTPSYDKTGRIVYHRLEWRPVDIILQSFPFPQLMLLPKIGRVLSVFIAKRLVPYVKYRLFSRVFAEHIAATKPDIVHAHDLICLMAGHDAARRCGARLIYDSHELEVYRNPPLPFLQRLYVYLVQRRYAGRAAEVITVGELVSRVLARQIGRSDINVVYNSPIIKGCKRSLREELGVGLSVPVIVYVGKLTRGRGITDMLRLLTKLNEVLFAAVGPCDEAQRKSVQRTAERLGVDRRFRILPPVPYEEVVEYIRGADLGVISVEPVTLSYQYCMPNKLFELAFANVPIIANDLDEIAKFLSEHQNGEIVDFEDRSELTYKTARMLGEKDKYSINDIAMESMSRKYSWESQIVTLREIYWRLLGHQARSPSSPRLVRQKADGRREGAF